jgi:hypothetical protein
MSRFPEKSVDIWHRGNIFVLLLRRIIGFPEKEQNAKKILSLLSYPDITFHLSLQQESQPASGGDGLYRGGEQS